MLTGGKSIQGITVKIFTLSKFSHAMVFVGGTLIHSDGGGVYSKNPQRMLFPKRSHVKVLRMKNKLTIPQQDSIKNHARSLVGTVYSTLEAALVLVPFKLELSERQFCSRLVAQCYAQAGITLVKNKDFCTPAQFDNPKLFDEVIEAVRLATQDDINFTKSRDVNLETQVDTINMLTKIREKYGKRIQTIKDVFKLLLNKPESDVDITRIALDSGYFEHAEVDMEVNPWRYSEYDFIEKSNILGIPIQKLARETHDVGNSSILVHEKELKNWIEIYKTHNLEFAYHHVILYKKLVNTDYIRKDMTNNIMRYYFK
ncbi:YiiX/YebB-like N1pC/P60 family cysteine hydrolase [Pectobacterium brasiliense]|uniref:YiiX/YebB-like N1pC/P60 family cysteine hydrolase n=1 Tax=Pectobacterium brasiliense TaxID=180957 RepID=UPI0030C83CE6